MRRPMTWVGLNKVVTGTNIVDDGQLRPGPAMFGALARVGFQPPPSRWTRAEHALKISLKLSKMKRMLRRPSTRSRINARTEVLTQYSRPTSSLILEAGDGIEPTLQFRS